MTTPIGTPSDGFSKFLWVPGQGTIATPNAPTVTELTGGTVKDFSLYMNEFTPNLAEDTAATVRINKTDTSTRPGHGQRTLTTLYAYNPQVVDSNEAALALLHNTIGYWIDRVGFPHSDIVEADDVVDVYLVQLGRQNRQRASNTDILISQTSYVIESWLGVTVAAS